MLKERVNSIFDEIVEIRRQIHQNPELSEKEVETSALICQKLDEMGIEYTKEVAGHGVMATIYGQNKEHGVGIRADIDALPIIEATDVPFKSRNEGVMHACGHDIHTAILLCTAKILNEMKEELPGCVRLIFQPSEETIGGAKQMIDDGCLNNPKIDNVIGLHVDPTSPAGSVVVTPGPMNAASTEFYVTVTGESCHGAHPYMGIDPLIPACAMVTNLQSIVTRRITAAEAGLITVGQFHSGTKNNIIPGETKFSGIIRVLNMKNREFIKNELIKMCTNTAEAYGASCKVEFQDSYPSLENHPVLGQWTTEAIEEAIGKENLIKNETPSLGADDFSYFCHNCNGFYYEIGAKKPDVEKTYPIHSEFFDPDEESIRTGILTQVAAVIKIMNEASKEW